ncbi:PREDICTED: uncharacterized protein LOC101306292 [Fragaria vesca subsp. vesca]
MVVLSVRYVTRRVTLLIIAIEILFEFCGRQGHIARICFNNPASPNYKPGNGEYRNNSGASLECQLCNKRGHTAINCPSRNEGSSVFVCQIYGLKGYTALDCPHRSNYAFQGSNPPATITAMSAHTHGASSSGVSPNEVWIRDTGATHHMTSDLRNLAIAHPYDSSNSITIGNGEGLSIKHIGSTEITPHTFQLNNVLHVPSLAVNLLSLNKLCKDNKCFIVMDGTEISEICV